MEPVSKVKLDNLTITQLAEIFTALWRRPNSPPILIIGPPGGGKTSIIGQTAASMSIHCETLMGNTLEPSDVVGIPHLKNGELVLAPPAWAMRIKDKHAVLNFDELNTARPATLAALLRVILERKVGDIDLGPNVHIVATMNPSSEAAHGWELPPAVANRFLHFAVAPTSVADWKKWAASIDESPEFHKLAAEFPLPSLYSEPTSGPFASPRAWTFALKAAAELTIAKMDDKVFPAIAAAVGAGLALSWRDAQKITFPTEDWSAADPGTVKLYFERKVAEIKSGSTEAAEELWQMIHVALDKHAPTLYVLLNKSKDILKPYVTPTGLAAIKAVQDKVK